MRSPCSRRRERVYVGDFSPNVRPVPALRARLLLAQGRLAEALDWARGRELSADDELSYVREYEHVTLARILLHQHAAEPAQSFLRTAYGLLERLRIAAEGGGRVGTLIEILVLQALAAATTRDHPGTRAAPGRAGGLRAGVRR